MDIIERITHMEALFDRALETRSIPEALHEYYFGGQWLADYQADERGELPPELKRGVLSEDGVWNLIAELEQPRDPASPAPVLLCCISSKS